MDLPKAACPFCSAEFDTPDAEEYLDIHHSSSCGCGANFCLVDADDVGATMLEVSGDAKGVVEFEVIPRFDDVPFDGAEEYDTPISAVFWRKI